MLDLQNICTFTELKEKFPDLVRVCCSVGFEYFNLDNENFCKVAYYYSDTNITYDPRDTRRGAIDYRKFKVILVYTDDQELE